MCEVYKRKVDTRDEFVPGTLDAAVRIKKHEDELKTNTNRFCAKELQKVN